MSDNRTSKQQLEIVEKFCDPVCLKPRFEETISNVLHCEFTFKIIVVSQCINVL